MPPAVDISSEATVQLGPFVAIRSTFWTLAPFANGPRPACLFVVIFLASQNREPTINLFDQKDASHVVCQSQL